VRIDERPMRVAARLEPGDIAVIDRPDLDRATAQALVAAHPAAVLNAARSTTGRHPNRGPGLLLAAGVVLVDDLGPDIMTLREGDRITVAGGTVTRGEHVVATGRRLTREDSEREVAEARRGVSAQVEAFAASTGEYLERESDLLMEGAGVPELRAGIAGRPALLILPDPGTAAELRRLRRWIRDTDPVIVAVEGAVETARSLRLRPDVIVGDMDMVPEAALRSGADLVVRAGHDGVAPGRARLDKLGVPYEVFTVTGGAEDASILLAEASGASAVVTVGAHFSLDDFLDRGRAGMAAAFFTRLRAGDRLVSSQTVRATYRPRISAWWLVLLVIVALAAVGAALWSTPWGRDVWESIVLRVSDLVNSGTGTGSVG
jgi:uncharacterized membrane-anchored protein